jgi:hypothetical protein
MSLIRASCFSQKIAAEICIFCNPRRSADYLFFLQFKAFLEHCRQMMAKKCLEDRFSARPFVPFF